MKSFILIYVYNNLSDEELNFWEQLNDKLGKKGYTLFLLLQITPKQPVSFLYAHFTEKLDHVIFPKILNTKFKYQNFSVYLEREHVWYGTSNKNRLKAAKFQKHKYTLLIKELNPALLVLGNGNHAGELILKDIANEQGISTVYVERGSLPKSWHIDENGITANTRIAHKHFSELSIKNKSSYSNYKPYYLNSKTTWWHQPNIKNTVDIRQHFNIKKNQKLILFANQIDNDTSNFLYNPLFSSNIEAFEWFCKTIKVQKLNAFVLVKRHPHYSGNENIFKNVMDEIGIEGVWVDTISMFNCLEQCDLVCAVNSTLNFEALIYEKPVLQLGKSILSHKEVTYEIITKSDTDPLLAWYNKTDFKEKLIKYELFMSYLIDNELSFYFEGAEEKGFNSVDFFINKLLPYIDSSKHGNFPKKFTKLNSYKLPKTLKQNIKRVYNKINKLMR